MPDPVDRYKNSMSSTVPLMSSTQDAYWCKAFPWVARKSIQPIPARCRPYEMKSDLSPGQASDLRLVGDHRATQPGPATHKRMQERDCCPMGRTRLSSLAGVFPRNKGLPDYCVPAHLRMRLCLCGDRGWRPEAVIAVIWLRNAPQGAGLVLTARAGRRKDGGFGYK